jgi:hypothetical protein
MEVPDDDCRLIDSEGENSVAIDGRDSNFGFRAGDLDLTGLVGGDLRCERVTTLVISETAKRRARQRRMFHFQNPIGRYYQSFHTNSIRSSAFAQCSVKEETETI